MTSAPAPDERADLRADCGRCVGLCCVAPAFAASADFAVDKPAGVACTHLRADAACGIHDRLRASGFPGCVVFDCFGAGQKVVQGTFGGGASWRDDAATATTMFAAFGAVRALQEMLWYLTEATERLGDGALREECRAAREHVRSLADAGPAELVALDPTASRRQVGELLARVSEELRPGVRRSPGARDRAGADLVGARMRGADLRGTSLRGALLVGADLRGADLREADLLGADLRGSDLRGTRLATALFLTQPQVEAGRGDRTTTLPPVLRRPLRWAG